MANDVKAKYETLRYKEKLRLSVARTWVHAKVGVRRTWAGLLAEAAVDALRHVNVVTRRFAAPILARFRLNGNCLWDKQMFVNSNS